MQSNSRKNITFAAALLTVVLLAATQIDAQSQSQAPAALTEAQAQAIVQALLAQQASGSKSLTPAQAQLLAQYLASQSQAAAAAPAMSAVQVPGAGQVPFQNLQPGGAATQSPLGPKKPGVVRIGVAQPKAQMGQGNSGSDVAEPIRNMIMQYLAGPTQETVPLAAMLSSQIAAEAKAKECDYVLYSAISQKMSSGGAMGFLKKAGPLTSMIPMVGMASGVTGAMAGAAASTAVASAASVAGTVKAKSEVTFEYKLMMPGNDTAALADMAKAKAKEDGEDVISPLIEQAATAIVAEVTKASK